MPETNRNMKKVVAIIYALDSALGSESGMGYNFALNLKKEYPDLTIITRSNNTNNDFSNVFYEDLPPWALKIKRLLKLHLGYYVLWQLYIALKYRRKFDVVYQVNFHSDWMPLFSFLVARSQWIVGPIGHHGSVTMIKAAYMYKPNFALRFTLNYFFKKFVFSVWNRFIINAFATRIYVLNKEHWFSHEDKRIVYLPSVGVERIGHPEKKKDIVLYVGRLVDLKGVCLIPKVVSNNQNFEFIIVGEGPLRNKLEKRCETYKNVDFTGWIDRNEVLDLFREARYLLFPSFEGAGMVVAEAASYGCIPIVLKGSGPSELMSNCCIEVQNIQDFKTLILDKEPLIEEKELLDYVHRNFIFQNKKIAIVKNEN